MPFNIFNSSNFQLNPAESSDRSFRILIIPTIWFNTTVTINANGFEGTLHAISFGNKLSDDEDTARSGSTNGYHVRCTGDDQTTPSKSKPCAVKQYSSEKNRSKCFLSGSPVFLCVFFLSFFTLLLSYRNETNYMLIYRWIGEKV